MLRSKPTTANPDESKKPPWEWRSSCIHHAPRRQLNEPTTNKKSTFLDEMNHLSTLARMSVEPKAENFPHQPVFLRASSAKKDVAHPHFREQQERTAGRDTPLPTIQRPRQKDTQNDLCTVSATNNKISNLHALLIMVTLVIGMWTRRSSASSNDHRTSCHFFTLRPEMKQKMRHCVGKLVGDVDNKTVAYQCGHHEGRPSDLTSPRFAARTQSVLLRW